MLKLEYFDLLSPAPIYLPNVGGIISPKLRDICSIGINMYQYYLTILLMDIKTYFNINRQGEPFESLSDEEMSQLNLFDLLTIHDSSARLLETILNFFIDGDVTYSPELRVFLVQKDNELTGMISKEQYPQVCDVICQRNCMKPNRQEDLSKVKSKKALEIIKKLQKGRSQSAKQTASDKNMELGNIISAVANKSQSLNILNIWDLTVYQVWDCFSRLLNNSIYDIQSMSVAAWGNKDHTFDAAAWYKTNDTAH